MAEMNKEQAERLVRHELTPEELLNLGSVDDATLRDISQRLPSLGSTRRRILEDDGEPVSFEVMKAYVDGTATATERDIVEGMMEVDPDFVEQIAELRGVAAEIQLDPSPVAPPESAKKRAGWLQWLSLPAIRIPLELGAAAGVALLVMMVYPRSSTAPSHDPALERSYLAQLSKAQEEAAKARGDAASLAQKLAESEKIVAAIVPPKGEQGILDGTVREIDGKAYEVIERPLDLSLSASKDIGFKRADQVAVVGAGRPVPGTLTGPDNEVVLNRETLIYVYRGPIRDPRVQVVGPDGLASSLEASPDGTYKLDGNALKPGKYTIEVLDPSESAKLRPLRSTVIIAGQETLRELEQYRNSVKNSHLLVARWLVTRGLFTAAERELALMGKGSVKALEMLNELQSLRKSLVLTPNQRG
jgi:hypothetical protein